jgi:hypothetical protein
MAHDHIIIAMDKKNEAAHKDAASCPKLRREGGTRPGFVIGR